MRHHQITASMAKEIALKLGAELNNEEADIFADGYNAALLHGQPAIPAYKMSFEQWVSQLVGTIDVDCGCVSTEAFMHWIRVAYDAGNSPVIPDGSIQEEKPPADPCEKCVDGARGGCTPCAFRK